jgi:flagellar FliJ protein
MSSRAFRLATVLRVRRIQEEMARGQVAAARMEVTRAEEEADAREAMARGDGPPRESDPVKYLAVVSHRLALARDAGIARAAVAEVEAVAAERHEEWREAATRVKPLESLEEAHRDAVRAADDRVAQAANDEMAGARHESNRRRADRESGTEQGSRSGHGATAG